MQKTVLRAIVLTILVVPAVLLATIGLGHQYRIHLSNKWQDSIDIPISMVDGRGERVIVFAPHCDDETLGVGGAIYRAVRAGATVRVVEMTNGDGFRVAAERALRRIKLTPEQYVQFAYHRQQETLNALSILGVKADAVTFLGYPDRGLVRMWTNFWDEQHRFRSYYTKHTSSPYRNSYRRNAPYCGEAVVADIESILQSNKPTHIYIPHPADGHPDHYAAYCLVMAAVEQLKAEHKDFASQIRVTTYLVHRGDWPVPKGYRAKLCLAPPAGLVSADTEWSALPLPDEVIKAKYKAILAHKTQTAMMKSFLLSFARKNELFGEVKTGSVHRVRDNSMITDGETADWRHIPPAIQDATGDNVLRDFYKSADVQSVYVCADSRKLYVRVDYVRNISRRIHYRVAIRGIGPTPDDDKRILEIVPGRKTSPANLRYAWHNRTMELDVPLGSFASDRQLFVAAETAGMKTSIDRTGWRVLELAPSKPVTRTRVARRL